MSSPGVPLNCIQYINRELLATDRRMWFAPKFHVILLTTVMTTQLVALLSTKLKIREKMTSWKDRGF